MTLYKALGNNREAFLGGHGTWHKPPRWMPRIDNPKACQRGYHLVTLEHLVEWLAPEIWIAEGRGRVDNSEPNKQAWESARLIKKTKWNKKVMRLFAADCAEHVLPIFDKAHPNDDRPRKAIEAARSGQNAAYYAAYAAADAASAAASAYDRKEERAWQIERLKYYLGD